MKGSLIGRGRTAEIFAWGNRQALKLFAAGWSPPAVEAEADRSRRIYAAGLPAPAVYGVIQVGDRYGILYERVDGPTLLSRLGAQPWQVFRIANFLAELHASVHSHQVPELPALRERLEKKIRTAQALPREMAQAVLDQLALLPDGEAVCHGDFHPDNVVLSPRGPVIIDWADATRGSPMADVARTSLLFRSASLPPHTPGRRWIEIARALFHRLYLRRYFQLRPVSSSELRAWQLPVAAARLSEGILEEEARILAMLSAWLTGH